MRGSFQLFLGDLQVVVAQEGGNQSMTVTQAGAGGYQPSPLSVATRNIRPNDLRTFAKKLMNLAELLEE